MCCQWQKNRPGVRFLELDSEQEVRIRLARQIVPYPKDNLVADSKKGILYFVEEELELVEVGLAMVLGGSKEIQSFIDDGLIFPPAGGEIDIWFHQEAVHFDFLEIRPYRLIQKVRGLVDPR